MADEAKLTDEEQAVLAAFRQMQQNAGGDEGDDTRAQFMRQMNDPDAQPADSVVNESLGMNPMNGAKIQFRSGKPGWQPEPAPKGYARWAGREQRRLEAQEAAKRRSEKNRKSIYARVDEAKDKLKGRNVQDTIALIELASPADREVLVLAEELGANRATVLRNPGFAVSNAVREEYARAVQTIEEAASVDPVEQPVPKT